MDQLFHYLENLKKNNQREWFHANKEDFETAKAKVKVIFDEVYDSLALIDHLEPLKVYRINRDIRFSLDKTPYKTHFSAFMGRKKPLHRGGFYLHVEPGNCFLGGGFWGPEKDDLLRIRQAIDHSDELEKILNAKQLKSAYGDLYGDGLKTAPKGFSKEHERIELLRKKQFLFIKKFKDDEIFQPDFAQKVTDAYQILLPFFYYMSEILTTNDNGETII